MVVTPEILRDFLAGEGIEAAIEGNTRLAFRDLRLARADSDFDAAFLYYAPREPAGLAGLVLSKGLSLATASGTELPALPDDAANCLVRADCDAYRLFSAVQGCFSVYNGWISGLYECIASGGGLAQLLALSHTVIKNPMLVDDSSYQTLAKIETYLDSDFFDGEYAFVQKNGYHSAQYVSTMLVSPVAWQSDFISPRPMVHIFDFLAHRTVYSTIKANAEVVGFLSVIELETPLTEGLIDICERFTLILSVAMAKRRRTALSRQKRLNNDLFLGVFNRRITDRDLMRAIFQQAGLADSSRYFIALLDTGSDASSDGFLLSRMVDLFSANMQDCCSIIDESDIILIARDRPGGDARKEVLRLSNEFLRRYRSIIGFSLSFDRLEDMPLYYAQAKAAARFGPLAYPGALVYGYDEIIGYDLLDRLGGEEERRSICHPAIGMLLKHDAEKGGNLISTLHVLLKCAGDTAMAAEMLFLHRNSLYYRMKQISDITGVDLQDEKTREHLVISLRAHDINNANAGLPAVEELSRASAEGQDEAPAGGQDAAAGSAGGP